MAHPIIHTDTAGTNIVCPWCYTLISRGDSIYMLEFAPERYSLGYCSRWCVVRDNADMITVASAYAATYQTG